MGSTGDLLFASGIIAAYGGEQPMGKGMKGTKSMTG
jgi:hypothetical protein